MRLTELAALADHNTTPGVAPLEVACPRCGADVDQPCRDDDGEVYRLGGRTKRHRGRLNRARNSQGSRQVVLGRVGDQVQALLALDPELAQQIEHELAGLEPEVAAKQLVERLDAL